MCFAPIFFFVSISMLSHIIIFFIFIYTDTMAEKSAREWLLFFEGFIDGEVQFYMFYMAPMQIARTYRLT